MKKIMLLMIFLVLSMFMVLGCSSDRPDFRDRQFGRGANMTDEQRQKMIEERQQIRGGDNMTDEQRKQMMEERGQIGRGDEMTEEQRQQMMEEMQQTAIESCNGKNEGDSCMILSPMREIEGSCKVQNEKLMCLTERPTRQR